MFDFNQWEEQNAHLRLWVINLLMVLCFLAFLQKKIENTMHKNVSKLFSQTIIKKESIAAFLIFFDMKKRENIICSISMKR